MPVNDTNSSTNVQATSDGASTNLYHNATGSSSQVLDAHPGVLGRAGPSARDLAASIIDAPLARAAVPASQRTGTFTRAFTQADATQAGLTVD
jgi:hypothetical protein